MAKNIANIKQTVNSVTKIITRNWRRRELELVKAYYELGGNESDLARRLGVTPQAINFLYPKKQIMKGGDGHASKT